MPNTVHYMITFLMSVCVCVCACVRVRMCACVCLRVIPSIINLSVSVTKFPVCLSPFA